MGRNVSSLVAFVLAVGGLVYLIMTRTLLHNNPITIVAQAGAVVLMVWARKTLGLRSFHAAASPTSGALITTGPYRWWRHPIYAAVIYFAWAGVLPQLTLPSGAAALLVTAGMVLRMRMEEKLLGEKYPEYDSYCKTVKRIVPFVV